MAKKESYYSRRRFRRTATSKRTKQFTLFDILLVDKQNHHQFQPLFYQVATARLEPSNISFPFRKIFQRSKNIQIRMAEVTKITPHF